MIEIITAFLAGATVVGIIAFILFIWWVSGMFRW